MSFSDSHLGVVWKVDIGKLIIVSNYKKVVFDSPLVASNICNFINKECT